MEMKDSIIDYILVPAGLMIMVAYHVWLIHRVRNHPTRTIIGINAINRRFWIHAMMEDVSKSGILTVQTMRNNIMASTVLASTAITLSSLIAVLMTNSGGYRPSKLSFGDKSSLILHVKFFCILSCFLMAFILNVQSIQYYSHAGLLINVPFKTGRGLNRQSTFEYVARTVSRGSLFWSLGLRAFYFSIPMFIWIFGPIPMFVTCVLLVSMLYFLDVSNEFGDVTVPLMNVDRDEEANSN
ncbi:uncharacterized protein LOC124912181 [Impatiens glandulifera]|uniref:uncharacterized protein LOC124912181 n=1 Tax=Impatiens glandulifera TaxID=253017 RepID=UPI001FB09FD7|nr:uncharacterized protein LOC124912181 [Impatiens glandulifera]